MGFDLLGKKEKPCSGCGACTAVCGCNAITMEPRANGFLYPRIDENKCVECGRCLQACDMETFRPTGKKPDCYAVRHRDMDEVRTSRSGGFFMALCQYVLEHQGVVFGCELDEQLYAVHRYQETYEGCKQFKGSKYVQSDLNNTYAECASFLLDGRWVLYSGTGCQVHGLIRYLNIRKVPVEKLIAVDIVCHGVPSPGVWETYIRLFEQREACSVKSVDFRNKANFGWAAHIETYTMADGRIINARNWTNGFYRHIMFRESCHRCEYTTTERNSDYTIADYWGVGKNAPAFDDDKGCSLVLIHSEKGRKIFNLVNDQIDCEPTILETSLQPQLTRPIWKGWDAKLFWKMYSCNPGKAVKIWFFPSAAWRFFEKCEKKMKMLIKRMLGRK